MNEVYHGLVGYGKIKNMFAVYILGFISILVLISAIYTIFNTPISTTTIPADPEKNTPSITTTKSEPFVWIYLSGFAILFALLAGFSYFMATSKVAEPFLAAQGVGDIASTFRHGLFGHGNNFNLGE